MTIFDNTTAFETIVERDNLYTTHKLMPTSGLAAQGAIRLVHGFYIT